MGKRKKHKIPIRKEKPPMGKYPRVQYEPDKILDKRISWHIRIIDRRGPFGWEKVGATTLWEGVFPKLSSFEGLTWQEIFRHEKNHPIKKNELSREAKKRLSEIEQDDIDGLISLGITKVKRILGIQDRNILKVLWWDPKHQACLSKKKHT